MPKASNDYTAVATAEKRLREILAIDGSINPGFEDAVLSALAHDGVTIELKPRLKAVQLTIPIPQPRPASKLGEFSPKPAPEDGYEDDDSVA